METSSHIEHTGPGAWRIAMDATEATLSVGTSGRRRSLSDPPGVSGAFYLRPSGALAGFALRLPLRPPAPGAEAPVLLWESADLESEGRAWLRFGRQEVCRAVSVLCAGVPGAHPYVKIVLETAFSSWSLRLPGVRWPRPRMVTLRLFSEIRPA
ncbi:hypothetical protein B0I32_106105 [Nonomuraea fuscirosea]|uniref:Uncharacterized protein n=1 Tax=Nonomuraea fuscirosea TaxID=1291556 RepID=A0A2T0N209_9ACTN|nr:hypothetical protein [Nonomuraea fuscirosea]PRX65969.1 hypothetical protein B0I32_106105 [Nonomuraea fuscirosea]